MAADTSAPSGLKPKSKNQKLLIYGGLAVGGVGGYIWYRRSQSSATSSTSSQSGIDPNTGVPYSQEAIDPATGVPYADEASYGGMGVTPGQLGQYNPLTGQYIPGYGTPTASVPASNSQWAQAAITALENLGFDPTTAATALGNYLNNQPLTSDQYSAVQAALGLEGNPPISVSPPVQQNPGGQTTPPAQTLSAIVGSVGTESGNAAAWIFGSPGQPGGAYNSAGPNIGTVPIGTTVNITGPAVTGAPAGDPNSPSTTYYPVNVNGVPGYLNAVNIKPGSITSSH